MYNIKTCGLIYIIFILVAKYSVKSQQYEGDLCILNSTGKSGRCALLEKCQPAITALQQKQILPQNCGFRGTQPIVCCEDSTDDIIADKTSTRTTTEIPTPIIQKQPKNITKVGEISKQKCKEYSKYVWEKVIPVILTAGTESYNKKFCVMEKQELIVGGELAKPKEFPHMALIGYDNPPKDTVWGCGGSLISENYVLTAGHCLFSRDYGDAKYVKLGDLNIESDSDDARPQIVNVAEIIRHPNYKPPVRYNDIALLKLEKSAVLSPYVRPACLHVDNQITARIVTATGWGKTSYFGNGGSKELLKVNLELFTERQCNDTYKNSISRRLPNGILQTTQLCAGSQDESKDTCQGDSGGPLTIQNRVEDCMYDIIGVTSFGKACGIVSTPGVYTRVSSYIEWIENTVWI